MFSLHKQLEARELLGLSINQRETMEPKVLGQGTKLQTGSHSHINSSGGESDKGIIVGQYGMLQMRSRVKSVAS